MYFWGIAFELFCISDYVVKYMYSMSLLVALSFLSIIAKGGNTGNTLMSLFRILMTISLLLFTGVLEVLHCVLVESPEALNVIKEGHIQSIISFLDKHGYNHKVVCAAFLCVWTKCCASFNTNGSKISNNCDYVPVVTEFNGWHAVFHLILVFYQCKCHHRMYHFIQGSEAVAAMVADFDLLFPNVGSFPCVYQAIAGWSADRLCSRCWRCYAPCVWAMVWQCGPIRTSSVTICCQKETCCSKHVWLIRSPGTIWSVYRITLFCQSCFSLPFALIHFNYVSFWVLLHLDSLFVHM